MDLKVLMLSILRIIGTATMISLIVACYPLPTPESPIPKSVPTVFVRRPIPFEPQISGRFSGLLNSNDLVTIHINNERGREVIYGTRSGNGPWEMVITNIRAGNYYIVSVEADGYVSQPITYTIYIDIQNNRMAEAVSNLDFHFVPSDP